MTYPIDPSRKIKGYIFRTSFTRDGITYYAKDYGKRAFKIPIYV